MVHDLCNLQTNYTPVLVTNITFLVLYAKNEVAAKISEFICRCCGCREDSHIKIKGILVGKLKLNP